MQAMVLRKLSYIRRILMLTIHRRFGKTALLEFSYSSRAVFVIFVDFDVFPKHWLITGFWYRLMEFISSF